MQQEWTAAGCQNNAELYTKWTKTTWKTFEETIRRGWNRSIKAYVVTGGGDDDDDGDIETKVTYSLRVQPPLPQ